MGVDFPSDTSATAPDLYPGAIVQCELGLEVTFKGGLVLVFSQFTASCCSHDHFPLITGTGINITPFLPSPQLSTPVCLKEEKIDPFKYIMILEDRRKLTH